MHFAKAITLSLAKHIYKKTKVQIIQDRYSTHLVTVKVLTLQSRELAGSQIHPSSSRWYVIHHSHRTKQSAAGLIIHGCMHVYEIIYTVNHVIR